MALHTEFMALFSRPLKASPRLKLLRKSPFPRPERLTERQTTHGGDKIRENPKAQAHGCLFVLFQFAHGIFVLVNSHQNEPGVTLQTVTAGEATHCREASIARSQFFLSEESHQEDRAYFNSVAIIQNIFEALFKKSPVYKTAKIKSISCFVVSSCC